jgi:hypothetical protein
MPSSVGGVQNGMAIYWQLYATIFWQSQAKFSGQKFSQAPNKYPAQAQH